MHAWHLPAHPRGDVPAQQVLQIGCIPVGCGAAVVVIAIAPKGGAVVRHHHDAVAAGGGLSDGRAKEGHAGREAGQAVLHCVEHPRLCIDKPEVVEVTLQGAKNKQRCTYVNILSE